MRREQARGEAGGVERGPEAIAGAGEVIAGCAGIQAGIDAAEEHAQVWRDDIRHSPAGRLSDLGLGGFTRLRVQTSHGGLFLSYLSAFTPCTMSAQHRYNQRNGTCRPHHRFERDLLRRRAALLSLILAGREPATTPTHRRTGARTRRPQTC